MAAHGLGFLARPALRRLFVGAPLLHLAEDALALELFLQDAQRLTDVVVANENLQSLSPVAGAGQKRGTRREPPEPFAEDGERKMRQDRPNRSGRTEVVSVVTLEDSYGFGKSWCHNTAGCHRHAAWRRAR